MDLYDLIRKYEKMGYFATKNNQIGTDSNPILVAGIAGIQMAGSRRIFFAHLHIEKKVII